VAGVARNGGADRSEDAGADDGADAEGRERDGAQGPLEATTPFAVGDALVDGLAREELVQWERPAGVNE
jgi:hypothetical protein